MRWAPSVIAWCLLASIAYGQSLLSYPGDRARGGGSTSSGAPSPLRIAALGDSNTQGYGLATNEDYPRKLNSLLGATYTVDNYGVGGYTCADVDAKWEADVKTRAYGVVLLMCGTNDHRTYGDSAAVIYARITALVAKVLATGAQVVLLTVMPAGTSFDPSYTAGMETTRDALNALIKATAGVTVVDLDAVVLGAGEPPALSDTFDGLHLNQAGAVKVAAAVHAAL